MTRRKLLVGGAVAFAGLAIFLFFLLVYKDKSEAALQIELEGTHNFHRINGDLYRAAQPSARGMRVYEEYGIKTVINLRSMHSDMDEVRGTGLVLVEIPIITWSISEGDVIAVLQAIRDADKPVLVHCQHGADRTGLMIAMYRIVEQGWSRENAAAEMLGGGYGFHSIWKNIPDFLEEADIEYIKRALR